MSDCGRTHNDEVVKAAAVAMWHSSKMQASATYDKGGSDRRVSAAMKVAADYSAKFSSNVTASTASSSTDKPRARSAATRSYVQMWRGERGGGERGAVCVHMASALETLRERAFETRDKNAAVPHVQMGTFVKVGVRGERFWCKVQCGKRVDGSFVGIVDNDLLRSPLRRGHEIVFQHSHVLEAAEPGEELTFKGLMAALGSASEAAMMWRDVREASGVGVKAHPRSWFVLPHEDNV